MTHCGMQLTRLRTAVDTNAKPLTVYHNVIIKGSCSGWRLQVHAESNEQTPKDW